jgi:hypothetical protein
MSVLAAATRTAIPRGNDDGPTAARFHRLFDIGAATRARGARSVVKVQISCKFPANFGGRHWVLYLAPIDPRRIDRVD